MYMCIATNELSTGDILSARNGGGGGGLSKYSLTTDIQNKLDSTSVQLVTWSAVPDNPVCTVSHMVCSTR